MKTGQLEELIARTDLFDPMWYQRTYPDVVSSGLSPINHFLKFGLALARDPGPRFSTIFYQHVYDPDVLGKTHPFIFHLQNPEVNIEKDLVLRAATYVLLQDNPARALQLARKYLPAHLVETIAALQANAACLTGDMWAWQTAVNRYLQRHDLAPLANRAGPTLLSQLWCGPLPKVTEGPLVSVIMPVWNARATVAIAIRSILEQTWQSLELIVVDDASTDGSWQILKDLAAQDPRVRLRRNTVNAGPYVSKNLGLQLAKGAYITGHDADDWAHPERLATHMKFVQTSPRALPVSMPYGLRMQPDGLFSHIRRAGVATSFDGWMQSVPIGTLFEASFLSNKLGYWDTVRFGADTEILLRARHLLGSGPLEIPLMTMFCLDVPDSLSNDMQHGTRVNNTGLSPTRRAYLSSVREWLYAQDMDASLYLDFPQRKARYWVPEQMRVSKAVVMDNLKSQ